MRKTKHFTFALLLLFLLIYQISLAEDILPWTEIGSLPANVSGRHMIAVGDYWYAFEGDEGNQGYLGTLYSQFQTGGSVGTWTSTSSRTVDRYGYAIAATNEYIYLVGGETSSNTGTNIVEYAHIEPDGSLSAWSLTSSMSQVRMAPAVVIYGNYIYAIGGHDDLGNPYSTITYAEIQPDGSLGNWNTMGSSLQTARSHSAAVVRNGFIYVFGGDNNGSGINTVERAEVFLPSGNLGSWGYENMLIELRASAGIAVIDDWVYMIGGNTGASAHSSVEYTAFHPVDGSLQAWQYSPSSLNFAAWHCHADVWNGFIYATANGVIEMTTQVSNAGTLQLLTPNGGEELIAGQTETITWSSTGSISDVALEYSINNGADWNVIEASTPNDGEYEWTVPQATSEYCLVKVSNASIPSVNDISDAVFTIFVCQLNSIADLDENCKVDLYDLALMSIDWLRNGNPFDTGFTEGLSAELLQAGDLVINEIMQNPAAVSDTAGEYFEIYNASGSPVDLNGLIISSQGDTGYTVNFPFAVQTGGYVVLGINSNYGTNGGVSVDIQYTNITLGNSTDDIILSNSSLTIDQVTWDNGATFPDPSGASMNLNPASQDALSNDLGSNWCESNSSFGDGDLGTPGTVNVNCEDCNLPDIGWSNLQFPITLQVSLGNPSDYVYGQVWIDGITDEPGATTCLLAELGFGPDGSDPSAGGWTWFQAQFNVDVGNNDEYKATLQPTQTGTFDYAYRYSSDEGLTWIYADADGSNNGYDTSQAGHLVVTE